MCTAGTGLGTEHLCLFPLKQIHQQTTKIYTVRGFSSLSSVLAQAPIKNMPPYFNTVLILLWLYMDKNGLYESFTSYTHKYLLNHYTRRHFHVLYPKSGTKMFKC